MASSVDIFIECKFIASVYWYPPYGNNNANPPVTLKDDSKQICSTIILCQVLFRPSIHRILPIGKTWPPTANEPLSQSLLEIFYLHVSAANLYYTVDGNRRRWHQRTDCDNCRINFNGAGRSTSQALAYRIVLVLVEVGRHSQSNATNYSINRSEGQGTCNEYSTVWMWMLKVKSIIEFLRPNPNHSLVFLSLSNSSRSLVARDLSPWGKPCLGELVIAWAND